ncbi:MAG: hypothetical protein LBG31_01585, partial [Prevotellaceae bacterium]|jgi:hypothetical protein|nr:hypothetical protein [Prevotellaceae bacterium]
LCPITGSTAGTFTQAVISNPSATVGSITTVAGNTRGFYVTTNPSTVTATLSNATGKFNWCAYGSDYPPNVLANTDGSYTLAGTPPFTLIASNGTTMQTVNGKTIATAAVTMTPATITDATGYPGLWCPYTGNDLYMDAMHRCQQRASGARNWEAYIKDVRDNQIYRIVQMPTNTWWMAEDLVWDGKPNPTATTYTVRGTARSCAAHYKCGRFYNSTATGAGAYAGTNSDRRASDVCPAGWILPSNNESCAVQTLSNIASVELGGEDTNGLSLGCCSNPSWTCGETHTSIVSGNATTVLHCTTVVLQCDTNRNFEGDGARIVRCVRD